MALHLLVVCTANICRSPMAERFLRRDAATRGVDATVASAGMLTNGEPASSGATEALAAYGLDPNQLGVRRWACVSSSAGGDQVGPTFDDAHELLVERVRPLVVRFAFAGRN